MICLLLIGCSVVGAVILWAACAVGSRADEMTAECYSPSVGEKDRENERR